MSANKKEDEPSLTERLAALVGEISFFDSVAAKAWREALFGHWDAGKYIVYDWEKQGLEQLKEEQLKEEQLIQLLQAAVQQAKKTTELKKFTLITGLPVIFPLVLIPLDVFYGTHDVYPATSLSNQGLLYVGLIAAAIWLIIAGRWGEHLYNRDSRQTVVIKEKVQDVVGHRQKAVLSAAPDPKAPESKLLSFGEDLGTLITGLDGRGSWKSCFFANQNNSEKVRQRLDAAKNKMTSLVNKEKIANGLLMLGLGLAYTVAAAPLITGDTTRLYCKLGLAGVMAVVCLALYAAFLRYKNQCQQTDAKTFRTELNSLMQPGI